MWPIRATDSSFSLTEERRIFSLRSSILDEARCFKASKEGRRKPEDFLVISSIWHSCEAVACRVEWLVLPRFFERGAQALSVEGSSVPYMA